MRGIDGPINKNDDPARHKDMMVLVTVRSEKIGTTRNGNIKKEYLEAKKYQEVCLSGQM